MVFGFLVTIKYLLKKSSFLDLLQFPNVFLMLSYHHLTMQKEMKDTCIFKKYFNGIKDHSKHFGEDPRQEDILD